MRFPWRSTTSKGSEIVCFESRLWLLPLNPDFLGFFCLPLEKKWEGQTGRLLPSVRPLSQYRGIEAVFFGRSFRVNAIDWSSRLRSLFVSLPCEIVRMIAVREAEIIEFIPLRLLLAIGITVLSNSLYRSSLHPNASTLPLSSVISPDFTRIRSSFIEPFCYMAIPGSLKFDATRRNYQFLRELEKISQK